MRGPRKGFEMKVTGKPAVAILLAVAVLLVWRVAVTHDTVDPEVAQEIRRALAVEYAGMVLPGIEAGVARHDKAGVSEGLKLLDVYMNRITFPSLKSRGGGDHFYVRAEILVDGGPPPKGKSVRYFRFSKSALLGYVYQEESFATSYYVPFMD